jgi:hypothetical protein
MTPAHLEALNDDLSPGRSVERLVTLSMMVDASATCGDADRLANVAHRYLSALVEHLAAWGRAMCDGDDGLLWATVQLGLLVAARRVIQAAIHGTATRRFARDLVSLTESYSGIVRTELAVARRRHLFGD